MELNPNPQQFDISTVLISKAKPSFRRAPAGLRFYVGEALLPDTESVAEFEIRTTNLPVDYRPPDNKYEFATLALDYVAHKGIVQPYRFGLINADDGVSTVAVVPLIESLFFARIRITNGTQGAVTLWSEHQVYAFTSEFECVRIGGFDEWMQWSRDTSPGGA